MTGRFSRAKTILLGLVVGVLGLTFIAYAAGTVLVGVQDKKPGGHRILLAVPAVVITLGLKLFPAASLREASAEARPWLPAIEAAGNELAKCPDARFVEIRDPTEWVSIAKRGGSLVIDVDSVDERVHLSFPVRLVPSIVRTLKMSTPPN